MVVRYTLTNQARSCLYWVNDVTKENENSMPDNQMPRSWVMQVLFEYVNKDAMFLNQYGTCFHFNKISSVVLFANPDLPECITSLKCASHSKRISHSARKPLGKL